jgi:putative membrane protein
MMEHLLATSIFPPLNASLNAISTVFLLAGFWFIKNGRKEAHQKSMTGALITSSLFLLCYVYYHYTSGHTTFPKEYPTARIIYLAILFPHVVLAVLNVPLIIITVMAAVKGNFEKHRKFAKVAFPIWLFVSVTGVIVYLMIYQWFPPTVSG